MLKQGLMKLKKKGWKINAATNWKKQGRIFKIWKISSQIQG